MKLISTKYNFSFKAFPVLFYGFLAMMIAFLIMNGALEKDPMMVFVPIVMAAVGFFYMKTSVNDLVDEVYDCGDSLLVRKNKEEERVPLSNIINVNFSMNVQPARITLTLDTPGKFGPEISFALPPKIYITPLPKSEVAQDLLVRAHRARSGRAA